MSLIEIAGRLAFAARCAAAGALSYLLATGVGLPHPVWASMSSLVVSQESFDATRHSIVGRVVGTIAGAVVAILVSEVAHQVGVGTAPQIAAAVGLCALFARGRPSIRVCLWTCPVVLLTASPGSSIEHAGLMRGSEVILGALSGGLIHWLMHWMRGSAIAVRQRRRSALWQRPANPGRSGRQIQRGNHWRMIRRLFPFTRNLVDHAGRAGRSQRRRQ
ncbi:MAG: rane protein [Herbaspirillum sp.]|jgi:uncharacterized membrane protein YccC|nr:rane protein [Herbaspirillum sp.]